MKLQVRLFARARDLAGTDVVELDVADQARVEELKAALAEQCPGLAPLVPSLLVAVGTDYASDQTTLREGDDVACFPPVSGG